MAHGLSGCRKFLYRLLAAAPFVLGLVWHGSAIAHAFLQSADPGADAVLKQAPAAVVVRFDARPEPVFSRLIVKDEQGVQVSQGNGEIDTADPMALKAVLSGMKKGVYHVYWSVVGRDGHRTEGGYTFTVK